ncbi:MAG: c-type cytochrome [Verrucomicrobia bacterium]|nr:c-type cytochrome [Verrucomicrobiota bacterium]
MRHFFLASLLALLAVTFVAGRRGDLSRRPPIEWFSDMDRQPRVQPQTGNRFFPDRLGSQPPLAGTVARGIPHAREPCQTGRVPGTTNWVDSAPVAFTPELLARGEQRYGVFCAVCHGAAGDGRGIATQPIYGMVGVANFHDPRLVRMPDGQVFDTIAHGSPAQLMPGYGAVVAVPDRWATLAYVRVLQRARLATLADVPPDAQSDLIHSAPPRAGEPAKTPQP